MIKINASMAQYALRNNLHVELFIWCYLKSINNSGFHSIDDFTECKINKLAIVRKLKSNVFFSVANGKIFLKSLKNMPTSLGKRTFFCDIEELNKFPRKLAHGSGKIIKEWNSTTIKYLMICLVACQYSGDKPYALKLISEDTGCSITIIQRALKNLYVEKWFQEQIQESGRSYYAGKKLINFSPNFYKLNIGSYFAKKPRSARII
jgi:hypothetical protein